jgi:hypothetical protein
MSKQSSVEWLYEQLTLTWYDYDSGKDILQQAKKMEKEQIMNAFEIGSDCIYDLNLPTSAEQYYNETYGSNK